VTGKTKEDERLRDAKEDKRQTDRSKDKSRKIF